MNPVGSHPTTILHAFLIIFTQFFRAHDKDRDPAAAFETLDVDEDGGGLDEGLMLPRAREKERLEVGEINPKDIQVYLAANVV